MVGPERSTTAGVTLDSKVKRPGRKDRFLVFADCANNLPVKNERNRLRALAIIIFLLTKIGLFPKLDSFQNWILYPSIKDRQSYYV